MKPYIFDEFFSSGKEESVSPFLTASSRPWGKNLPLKSALFAAFLLLFAFASSFAHPSGGYFLLSFVYFLVGTPALINSLEDLKNFEINIDVLMTMAALLSVVIGSGYEGALLLVLFELSGAMESAVMQKTKSAIKTLNDLSPRFAFVVTEKGELIQRSVKEVTIGTLLLIKAGEIIPLDGIVTSGSSFVNMVHLTGESAPVPKLPGSSVQAGARNLDGTLTIRVNRTSNDSTLSRIIDLISEASLAKPELERFLDKFGKWYALGIISLSGLFAFTLPYLFDLPFLGNEGSVYRALTFLIAASPCALIIATPTPYLSAISSCAKKGILLKGGMLLDSLSRCSIIAFDKTGTLTTGKLSCTEIIPLSPQGFDPNTALAIAAGLERHAVHPVAEAICGLAQEKQILPSPIDDFKSVPGYGLEGRVGTCQVFIGNAAYISLKCPLPKDTELNTFLLIGDALFAFRFEDSIRSDIKPVLDTLKKQNFHLAMLTGDTSATAHLVAKNLGIDSVFAELRPEDKLTKIAELSKHGDVIMIGDGINDAPALARATVGISMGSIGSATAIEASDVVFLNDDLTLLPWLSRKAHATLRILKQNLTLALGVIFLATTPALLGIVPLWAAVLLHEGGTVLVGLNSLRLLRR
ncbi:MAG: cation-translocating P-type ATPase [Chlamydiota bacterium]